MVALFQWFCFSLRAVLKMVAMLLIWANTALNAYHWRTTLFWILCHWDLNVVLLRSFCDTLFSVTKIKKYSCFTFYWGFPPEGTVQQDSAIPGNSAHWWKILIFFMLVPIHLCISRNLSQDLFFSLLISHTTFLPVTTKANIQMLILKIFNYSSILVF